MSFSIISSIGPCHFSCIFCRQWSRQSQADPLSLPGKKTNLTTTNSLLDLRKQSVQWFVFTCCLSFTESPQFLSRSSQEHARLNSCSLLAHKTLPNCSTILRFDHRSLGPRSSISQWGERVQRKNSFCRLIICSAHTLHKVRCLYNSLQQISMER